MADDLTNGEQSLNATMRKFGAPGTIIREYSRWIVLLRPAQVTLGSLVLAARDTASAFSALDPASFSELHRVVGDTEQALSRAFSYDKLNYLMLMMVDTDVHFHVIPRYAANRHFSGIDFADSGWPGPPELGRVTDTGEALNGAIRAHLQSCWPEPERPSK